MANVNISNCTFAVSTKWDADMVDVMKTVADALLNLTELFKAQDSKGINLDAMVKIDSPTGNVAVDSPITMNDDSIMGVSDEQDPED